MTSSGITPGMLGVKASKMHLNLVLMTFIKNHYLVAFLALFMR
jgi:hypothetical protein